MRFIGPTVVVGCCVMTLVSYFFAAALIQVCDDSYQYVIMAHASLADGIFSYPGRHWPSGYSQALALAAEIFGSNLAGAVLPINLMSFAVCLLMPTLVASSIFKSSKESLTAAVGMVAYLTTVVLATGYLRTIMSEILFLAFVSICLSCLGFANARRWWLCVIAAIAAFLAIRVRYVGVLLLVPMACQFVWAWWSTGIPRGVVCRVASWSAATLGALAVLFYEHEIRTGEFQLLSSRLQHRVFSPGDPYESVMNIVGGIFQIFGSEWQTIFVFILTFGVLLATMFITVRLLDGRVRSGLDHAWIDVKVILPWIIWFTVYLLFIYTWMMNGRARFGSSTRYHLIYLMALPLPLTFVAQYLTAMRAAAVSSFALLTAAMIFVSPAWRKDLEFGNPYGFQKFVTEDVNLEDHLASDSLLLPQSFYPNCNNILAPIGSRDFVRCYEDQLWFNLRNPNSVTFASLVGPMLLFSKGMKVYAHSDKQRGFPPGRYARLRMVETGTWEVRIGEQVPRKYAGINYIPRNSMPIVSR